MSQTKAILEVLSDGDWHSVREIHARAGYSRLNSRVSELRKAGHCIECKRVPKSKSVDAYCYRLILSMPLPASQLLMEEL